MSIDQLTLTKHGVLYSTVRKGQDSYRVISVPPSLILLRYSSEGSARIRWEEALGDCPDMAAVRRGYLKKQSNSACRPVAR
jgi:hypothetical protein